MVQMPGGKVVTGNDEIRICGGDRMTSKLLPVVHHSKPGCSTSDLGQKQTCRLETAMSALAPKADIAERQSDVR